jgi:hypothetical protein
MRVGLGSCDLKGAAENTPERAEAKGLWLHEYAAEAMAPEDFDTYSDRGTKRFDILSIYI